MTTSVAISRYASTLMAFMPDSACQYSGSTPQPILETSSAAIPIRVCSTSTNRSHTRHHSALIVSLPCVCSHGICLEAFPGIEYKLSPTQYGLIISAPLPNEIEDHIEHLRAPEVALVFCAVDQHQPRVHAVFEKPLVHLDRLPVGDTVSAVPCSSIVGG